MNFHQQMELLFGTDDACGVTFECEETGRIHTAANLPKDISCISHLPNGGSGVCCTDYAALVYARLTGRVQIFGFANEDNPHCRVVREEWHPGGHDFAVVDDRYIVDPWARLVYSGEVHFPIVYDLVDEAQLAEEVYGPRRRWRHMVEAEAHVAKMKPVPAADLTTLGKVPPRPLPESLKRHIHGAQA